MQREFQCRRSYQIAAGNEIPEGKLKRDVLEITPKILCVSAVRCPSKRKKVHIWPDGEQLMTKTEIELLKELGYSPIQIFNLTDKEVKKILANATGPKFISERGAVGDLESAQGAQ